MTDPEVKQSLLFRKKSFNSIWDDQNDNDQTVGYSTGARTYVFHPKLTGHGNLSAQNRTAEDRLAEAVSLSAALELNILSADVINLNKVRPSTFLGKGKLEEMAAIIEVNNVELVVADCELSPGQQRNLERELQVKVIDRTGLILEIFSERAQTKEGVMQVELAHLSYQKSRLVRSWTHLERQRGGVGFMGGPGESQIESDRRLLDERIVKLKKLLENVTRTRELHRNNRRKVPYPIVALVGYTNAGKSTLFNHLTGAKVMAEDLLFATLDPTMRNVDMPNGQQAIFSDTVGFISDLPTNLIAAFRATLEEVLEADVILHIRDISHPETEAQKEDVMMILQSLGIKDEKEKKIFEVWNKIDLVSEEASEVLFNTAERNDNVVIVSATTGAGVDDLLNHLDLKLAEDKKLFELKFNHTDGADVSLFYRYGEVIDRVDDEDHTMIKVRLDAAAIGQLIKMGKMPDIPEMEEINED